MGQYPGFHYIDWLELKEHLSATNSRLSPRPQGTAPVVGCYAVKVLLGYRLRLLLFSWGSSGLNFNSNVSEKKWHLLDTL
jgi:hypothetical protein